MNHVLIDHIEVSNVGYTVYNKKKKLPCMSSKLTLTCRRWNARLSFSPHYNTIRRYLFNILWQNGFVRVDTSKTMQWYIFQMHIIMLNYIAYNNSLDGSEWSLYDAFFNKINASLSNCQIAYKSVWDQKKRIVLEMHQLFYITLAYIVYTYIKSSCWSINVKCKHKERLIFDRLSVRVFFRLLNFPKSW